MRQRVSRVSWLWFAFAAAVALPWAGCGSGTDTPPGGGTTTSSTTGTGGAGGVGGTGGAGGAGGIAGTGGSGGGNGGAGGSVSCGPDEKDCGGQCVAVDDPQYGCTAAGCAPCDLPNAGSLCNAGACEVGACDPGFDNCDGDDANGCEIESATDPENCGACGNECVFPNAEATCVGSACAPGACEAPHQDCDGDAANGCEAVVGTDPDHCAGCNMPCAPGEQCQAGVCGVFCGPGLANCDNDATNGCETQLGTLNDCGFCGDACDLTNATAACVAGACQVSACDAGYQDCDGLDGNGCETHTDGSAVDCGACGVVCPGGPNSTPVCAQGACGLVCDGGFEDCDGNAANGCEAATTTDAQNCGACGFACTAQNGTPVCVAGQCDIASCAAGYADCNGAEADGCEVDITDSTAHCGACGNGCPGVPNGVPDCNAGACTGICNPGYANCNGAPGDGCEVDTQTDTAHCGSCATACSVANGTAGCAAGACVIASCNPGYADCNGSAADGCETNTDVSLDNCGGCGLNCMVANGTPACTAGTCTIAACNPGVGDCNNNPADGCETSVTSNVNNCGSCGNMCNFPHAGSACSNGSCQLTGCNPGYQNCNGSAADGCEVNVTTDLGNCGSCGNACSVANGTPACANGTCAVASCAAGYANCNNNPADGCEVNTQTSTANCGACGAACSIANGSPACQAGSCAIAGCNAGYANCNGNAVDGCETNLQTSTANCGGCGNVCSVANGSAACQGGACAVGSCNAGYANCDSNPANGCEVNTQTSAQNCGSCGNVCSVANGTAGCQGGGCTVGSCNAGYANCDGSTANGCEVNTQTSVNNCGSCGNTCSVANGTAGCQGGSCTVASCNAGSANCDGSAANGCETNVLSSVGNCGGCGNVCSVANGTPACAGGTCAIASCNPGYGNCNGSPADGCETNLQNSAAHCGACGNTCSLPNAVAACSAGGCVIASCNAGYANCDGIAANGCEVNTQTSLGNCGACGNACSVANGTAACLSGSCAVAGCNAGYGNCDGSAANGCEVNTQTSVNNCGSCGNTCSVANGSASCSGGVCAVAGCNGGYANCNGVASDGCEINLASDVANCGGCGNSCGSVCSGNIASLSCSAGSCNVTACNSSYYNVDGACSNGCECQSSGATSTCALPSSLGTVNLGGSTSVTANVVPSGNEDWYVVTFTGNADPNYHPRVRFSGNPGNAFRFDILVNCQGSSLSCGTEGGLATSKTDWETFRPAANGYNNVIPPVGNNGTILVRVYRAAGSPITCDSYTLAVSN